MSERAVYGPVADGAQESAWEQSARDQTPFALRVVESGRTVMARVEGPLDLEHSEPFLQRLHMVGLHRRCMVVDLRRADYVDSSGVRALLRFHAEVEAAGGELRLVVERGSRVERVFTLLRLMEKLHVFHSATEAWVRAREAA